MKIKQTILTSLLGIVLTAEGWNDFIQRYGPSGHIPTIPLYFKAPKKTVRDQEQLENKIKALEQSIENMQRELSKQQEPKEATQNDAPAPIAFIDQEQTTDFDALLDNKSSTTAHKTTISKEILLTIARQQLAEYQEAHQLTAANVD